MQNLSVSLLTGQLSEEGNSTTAPYRTTCWYTTSTYHYNKFQLLATYGAALGITVACMILGLRAVHQNGAEESFSFSRIVGAVLNKSLFNDRYELTEASWLTAGGSPEGRLQVVHATYGRDGVSDNVLDKLL